MSSIFLTTNRRDKTTGLCFNAAKSNYRVEIEYQKDEPVMRIRDKTYSLSHIQSINGYEPLGVKIMRSLSEVTDLDRFIASEYDGWAKISVENIEQRDGLTIIQTPEEDINWYFDEPVLWDKDQEDFVKLVENFSNGDSSQLENIYTRPINATLEDNVSVKKHKDSSWQVALEEPDENQEEDMSSLINFDLKSVLGTMSLLTMIFIIVFLTVLLFI